MIRRLPHFVKPDEDRIAQLRDLEEYIAAAMAKSDCREPARRAQLLLAAARSARSASR
jgi:hypothetical protein